MAQVLYPITEAVAEEYRKLQPDNRITVGVSGTGGGFKKFSRGETDISNASRPIKESKAKAYAENNILFIEIPVAYDGLAVVILILGWTTVSICRVVIFFFSIIKI